MKLVYISTLSFIVGCTTINPSFDIPEIDLDEDIKSISNIREQGSDTAESLKKKVGTVEERVPEYTGWSGVYEDIDTLDNLFKVDLYNVGVSLKNKDEQVQDALNKLEKIDKDKTALQEELRKIKEDKQKRAYSMMIMAGVAAIGIGTILAISFSPKLGISVGLIGLTWIALGRFFLEWAWVLDLLTFATLGLSLLYVFFKYKHMLFDIMTSIEDTAEEGVPALNDKILEKSKKDTVIQFSKVRDRHTKRKLKTTKDNNGRRCL